MNRSTARSVSHRIRRLTLACGIAVVGFALFNGVATAAASPVVDPELHTQPTNLPPGGQGVFWLNIQNISDETLQPGFTVEWHLPTGITADQKVRAGAANNDWGNSWNCGAINGSSDFSCTLQNPLPGRSFTQLEYIVVDIAPSAGGVLQTSVDLSGGGLAAPITETEDSTIDVRPADFGIVPGTLEAGFFGPDGATPVTQAGAHPYEATFQFDINSKSIPSTVEIAPVQTIASGNLRDITTDLPPGFLGDPTAVGECKPSALAAGQCPASSQVGMVRLTAAGVDDVFRPYYQPVFNMARPDGVVNDLGFQIQGFPVHLKSFLDPRRNYAISTRVSDINETVPVFDQKLTLWGNPSDPSHDLERTACFGGTGCARPGCPTGGIPCPVAPSKPFLTVPEQCDDNSTFTLRTYDSWENTGFFGPDVNTTLPYHFTGCELGQQQFAPSVVVAPTSDQADSPTGLKVTAQVPQDTNPNAVVTPQVKTIDVTLPQGMSLNPAFADGLAECSEAQLGISHAGVPNGDPVACPDNSRIGDISLTTPALPLPLEGTIYLAEQQGGNPFNSLFAMYVEAHDTENRGVILKIPGRIELDPDSGQIRTVFDELPELPFDSLTVNFPGGPRAALINPATCGTKTFAGTLNTYAEPGTDVPILDTFDVAKGPGGGSCSAGLASRPFAPSFTAGTEHPVAGSYSPFVLGLTRQDGEQELTKISADLPAGLVGKLAGLESCSDAALSSISDEPGTGQDEIDTPSCPASSRVGYVNVGVGAGSSLYYNHGEVYLAGPYKGAPISLAIVTPAVAGGVDLGSILTRTAIYVDQDDAQLHAVSDAIPTILKGVPLHIREVRTILDRSNFTLNPTNCETMQIGGSAGGAGGILNSASDDTSAPIADRFQVGGCRGLAFTPKLSLRLSGKTQRAGNPALRAVLTQPAGEANIARASVTLPKSEFIDNRHINNPCTRVQFNAGAGNGAECPASSILGYARAFTPLLDKPLEGPVYFRSNGGDRELPDLVASLDGQVHLNVVGFIDSVRTKGSDVSRTRNTFALVPDAPVSKFVLRLEGGKKGLLQNSANLCKVKNVAKVKLRGQNGKTKSTSVRVANDCAGKKSGKAQNQR
ncbi:MAG: hypothetical protein ACJ75T_01885 [Solirubrobacterales bacterium]